MDTKTYLTCPACNELMMMQPDGSWKCEVCNPVKEDAPICKTQTCKRPLTKLGPPWNCWICLYCHDHPDVVNKKMKNMKPDKREAKYVDRPMTEERVRELAGMSEEKVRDIIRETMAEFSTKEQPDPDYPPSQERINKLIQEGLEMDEPEETVEDVERRVQQNLEKQEAAKPETWLQKAKRLGVQTHIPGGMGMRKKAEVLADIAKVEGKGK